MALDSVLEQALALPVRERRELVEVLLCSLEDEDGDGQDEGDASPAWTEAWAAELERRAVQVDQGRARALPHDEVFAELRARFSRR